MRPNTWHRSKASSWTSPKPKHGSETRMSGGQAHVPSGVFLCPNFKAVALIHPLSIMSPPNAVSESLSQTQKSTSKHVPGGLVFPCTSVSLHRALASRPSQCSPGPPRWPWLAGSFPQSQTPGILLSRILCLQE